jgi:DNA-binding CsgD family transcriptional regulator
MYAITPLGGQNFYGLGFFRGNGQPPFSEQQRQIVFFLTTEVCGLVNSGIPVERGDRLAQLSPRMRSVLSLLLDGYRCREIAELYHLSPHTVKGYIRDLYRHFDVTSQFSLIHHFREKETPSSI